MWDWLDIREVVRWLVGEDAPTEALLSPTQSLLFAMGVLVLVSAFLILISWRDTSRREARTRKLKADEIDNYRWRRI